MAKPKEDRKLLNEEPLLVLPLLAKALGLNEAIILQQIHYWLTINEGKESNFKDGYYWTFNSSGGWRKQFPFWSKKTIERTLRKLENNGIVVTGCYNKLGFDRTKWYRLDYAKLIEACPLDHNGQIQWIKKVQPLHQNDLMGEATHCSKMTSPIPETNTNRLAPENDIPEREYTSVIKNELLKDNDGYGSLYKPTPSPSSRGARPGRGTNQLKIIEYLADFGEGGAKAISEATRIPEVAVRNCLSQNKGLFQIVSRGIYALKDGSHASESVLTSLDGSHSTQKPGG
jgi:hypothetical protein